MNYLNPVGSLVALVFFSLGCGNVVSDQSCKASSLTTVKNIHSSLPSSWVSEFNSIYAILESLTPIGAENYNRVEIYAWNDNTADPYAGIDGGAYIGGNDCTKQFVTEIPQAEFDNSDWHRYSVVAHEYFHLYQMHQNIHQGRTRDDPNGFSIKWLVEGAAATFESLYILEKYSNNYFTKQNSLSSVLDNPASLESYDIEDPNYSNSVYLNLALVKELVSAGKTETQAFTLVLNTFMAQKPTNSNWKTIFASTFGFSVESFYSTIPNYRGNTATDEVPELAPTSPPALDAIF